MRPWADWLELRTPWTVWRAWNALFTHWASLLKDTGALVILGVGELTMVAKVLSELEAGFDRWLFVLVLAAALYLVATLLLIRMLQVTPGRLGRLTVAERVLG
jgi:ABC-type amino acid transport system permease subunit